MDELKRTILRAIILNCYEGSMEKALLHEEEIMKQMDDIFTYLCKQKEMVKELGKKDKKNSALTCDENGNIIFDEGTLIHCAGKCDYDKLLSIKKYGIVAGDFIGIPEFNNGETYFCADFYRADRELSSREFIDRISDSDKTTARGPFGKRLKNITKLAFIFDSTDELRELMDTDMYKPENSNHPMQSALNLLESYKGDKNGQVSAIPYGIPSTFISGIIAGDRIYGNNSRNVSKLLYIK